MRADIRSYCKNCITCAQVKIGHNHKAGAVLAFPATRFNECVELDYVGPLPVTENENRYILTMIDKFTRYLVCIPTPNCDAATTYQAILDHWILKYGAPTALLSDRGTHFIGTYADLLSRLFKIKWSHGLAYRPQTQGMVERSHRYLKERLVSHVIDRNQSLLGDDRVDWDVILQTVVFSYNSTPTRTTNHSPHELVFGHPLNILLGHDLNWEPNEREIAEFEPNQVMTTLQTQLAALREGALLAQSRYTARVRQDWNKKSVKTYFRPGDLVMVYQAKGIGNQRSLAPRYAGPYRVLGQVTTVTYELEDMERRTRMNQHVSNLKLYRKKEPPPLEPHRSRSEPIEKRNPLPDPPGPDNAGDPRRPEEMYAVVGEQVAMLTEYGVLNTQQGHNALQLIAHPSQMKVAACQAFMSKVYNLYNGEGHPPKTQQVTPWPVAVYMATLLKQINPKPESVIDLMSGEGTLMHAVYQVLQRQPTSADLMIERDRERAMKPPSVLMNRAGTRLLITDIFTTEFLETAFVNYGSMVITNPDHRNIFATLEIAIELTKPKIGQPMRPTIIALLPTGFFGQNAKRHRKYLYSRLTIVEEHIIGRQAYVVNTPQAKRTSDSIYIIRHSRPGDDKRTHVTFFASDAIFGNDTEVYQSNLADVQPKPPVLNTQGQNKPTLPVKLPDAPPKG